MRENPVKQALAAGVTPIGTMVCEFSRATCGDSSRIGKLASR